MTGAVGRLIGVSLGPGDPGCLTLRAWQVLQGAAAWAYPVTAPEGESYALSIARRAGLSAPADATPLVFPMTRDPETLAAAWARAAAAVGELLRQGRDVAFLVEGDASTYATFSHLARAVAAEVPEAEVETVPGVPSFVAAPARIGWPLASQGETLAVLPAGYSIDTVARFLDEVDSLVLLKIRPLLDSVLELLEARGLLGHAAFVERAGTPQERIVTDLASLRGETVHYLSLLLVRCGPGPGQARSPGEGEGA